MNDVIYFLLYDMPFDYTRLYVQMKEKLDFYDIVANGNGNIVTCKKGEALKSVSTNETIHLMRRFIVVFPFSLF